MRRMITYSLDGYCKYLTVEFTISDDAKIPESAINKALMIAMNYLIENMEPTEQEEPEQGSFFISSSIVYTS